MTEPHESTDAIGERIRSAVETVQAPPDLRLRVDDAYAKKGRASRWPSGRVLAGGLASAAAVVAVLAFVVLPGSDPTVADAAAFTLKAPAPLGPVHPWKDRRYVDQEVDGIWFPNYGYDTRWHAVGARTGTVGGRRAVAVTYDNGIHRFVYTIVDGAPLPVSHADATATAGGTKVAVLKQAGATIVTWRRDGHTCVLASRTATVQQLLRAVDWRAV